jgi:hypothetical protein
MEAVGMGDFRLSAPAHQAFLLIQMYLFQDTRFFKRQQDFFGKSWMEVGG